MSRLENKIEAKNRSVFEVLDKKKYTVDFYQREYSWQQGHIEQLVTDLTSAFLNQELNRSAVMVFLACTVYPHNILIFSYSKS